MTSADDGARGSVSANGSDRGTCRRTPGLRMVGLLFRLRLCLLLGWHLLLGWRGWWCLR
jgi:hypothetical protein